MTVRTHRADLTGSAPDFDQVADELYGLPPEEFTATRTGYEKQAKQAGDPDLARRIHALAKPSVTAWLANQLAREHRDELQPLLELGAGLREATRALAGDRLRHLSRQQHELVYALVQQGRQLARAAGRPVSEDTARGLEDTLHAALADQHAADLLLAGRLTQALHRGGFTPSADPDSLTPAAPRRKSVASTSAATADRQAEQRHRAERDLTDAEHAVAEADSARADAQTQLTAADEALADDRNQVEELRGQLDAALSAQSEAEQRRRGRATALQRAERALSDAQRRQVDAQARRDRLAGDE